MVNQTKKEWLLGFIAYHSGKKIKHLEEKEGVIVGYLDEFKQPFFVYSEDLTNAAQYLSKTKYIITDYNMKNLKELEAYWSLLSDNEQTILCLADYDNDKYALLKPHLHSMIVQKDNLRKSIHSLMAY